MTVSQGIGAAMVNLAEAQRLLQLEPSVDPDFFGEWQGVLPAVSDLDREFCDRLRRRYFYYADRGAITESTVSLILVAPLLDYLGWCDPPYQVRGERLVRLAVEDGAQTLQGLIDVLVVQGDLWVVLLESKRYGFSVRQALPQTLAYLMGNPTNTVSYGLITTGEDFLFVKVDRSRNLYDVSDKLTLSLRRNNALERVMQILRHLVPLN